jgi:hypothetical protein
VPLDAAWFQARADELRTEEEAARRELEDASSAEERTAIRGELDEIRAERDELRARVEALEGARPPAPATTDETAVDDDDGEEESKKPKMRKGRKHGQVYQDRPGEPGYVYQGADEADLVPVEEPAA